MRQELKRFSKWATYPQLYVNGELVGGLDICKELVEAGELEKYCKVETEKKQITPDLIENKLTQALDATLVKAEDLSDGCGMKFSILIVSPRFDGMREYSLLLRNVCCSKQRNALMLFDVYLMPCMLLFPFSLTFSPLRVE